MASNEDFTTKYRMPEHPPIKPEERSRAYKDGYDFAMKAKTEEELAQLRAIIRATGAPLGRTLPDGTVSMFGSERTIDQYEGARDGLRDKKVRDAQPPEPVDEGY